MTDRIPIAEPDLAADARTGAMRVMVEGRLAEGREVRRFESDFAQECGTDHAVATANGTAALHAALEGLGIGEGDRVVTTPFSFVATANAVRLAGARPVFADVDPQTLNLDPEAVEELLRSKAIDAILVVHLYGHPAEMEHFSELAEEYDCALLEDAAQAHGARYRGQPVGSIGDVGCFSFYPTKNMTTGEGGMVVTDDARVRERVRRYVDHGRTEGYEHESVGHNYRMTNVAATIGLSQLRRLSEFVQDRRRNAALLTELLEDGVAEAVTPVEREAVDHAYHQYTIRHPDRDALAAHLDEWEIDTGVYYPRAIHQQPAYADVDASCPVAERATEEVLSLPIHPGVSEPEIRKIAREVNAHDRARLRA